MSTDKSVVIVAAARTPIGAFQGDFAKLAAWELGGQAIRSAAARSGLDPETVDDVFMGCVLTAGQGQAPARQAAFAAGLPISVPATTVNKMCGSGMQSVIMAHDAIMARPDAILVAGGMESMTNAPYLLPKARAGLRLGHGAIVDHMFLDGLEDAYDRGRPMGAFAEDAAERYQFTRQQQDDYAAASLQRAIDATRDGRFKSEITPVGVESRDGPRTIARDEQPFKADPTKIPQLKPVFKAGGTVTAANASSISDGAAALIMTSLQAARRRDLQPRARIVGVARFAAEPSLFTSAPVAAIHRLLAGINWSVFDVDLWEINEAFAVVPLIAMRELGMPHEKLNVHGGACALGHPIGASGARILVTLLAALETYDLKRGVATVCIGGGEATAVAIERMG